MINSIFIIILSNFKCKEIKVIFQSIFDKKISLKIKMMSSHKKRNFKTIFLIWSNPDNYFNFPWKIIILINQNIAFKRRIIYKFFSKKIAIKMKDKNQ